MQCMIETCFEMVKSLEHEKSWRYSHYNPKIFKIVTYEVKLLILQFFFFDIKYLE